MLGGSSTPRKGESGMARTYREMAIENMVRPVEKAMSRVIDSWGDLPPPMKEAIEQFCTQLNAAIDCVEFIKRALDLTIDDHESLSHTKGECKYHVVFIPKYRRKVLYGELRKHLGEVFRKLQCGSKVGSRKGI
jgi:hypothetical protein